jgi:hypothetical protein
MRIGSKIRKIPMTRYHLQKKEREIKDTWIAG